MGNRGFYGFSSGVKNGFNGFGPAIEIKPPSFAPPLCWYMADSLSLADAAAVATWTDQSGNGVNATQSNSSYRPKFYNAVKNGLPAIRFDNTDDRFVCPISDTGGNYTFMAVLSPTSATAGHYLFDSRQTTGNVNRISCQISDGSLARHAYTYGAAPSGLPVGAPVTVGWQILTWVFNGTSSQALIYYNLGLSISGPYAPNPMYSTYAILGSGYNGAVPLYSDLGEFIAWPFAFSQSEVFSVASYLNHKWEVF